MNVSLTKETVATFCLREGSAVLRNGEVFVKSAAGMALVWMDRFGNRKYSYGSSEINLFDPFPGETTVAVTLLYMPGDEYHPSGHINMEEGA